MEFDMKRKRLDEIAIRLDEIETTDEEKRLDEIVETKKMQTHPPKIFDTFFGMASKNDCGLHSFV